MRSLTRSEEILCHLRAPDNLGGGLGLFLPSTFTPVSDSDRSAESNGTLLLAREQDCGEGGGHRRRNAFDGERLAAGSVIHCIRWTYVCAHVQALGCEWCSTDRHRGSRGRHYCGISYKTNINLYLVVHFY